MIFTGEICLDRDKLLKGKRGMNTALSLKIEKQLALEEGTLMTPQVFYDIKVEKRKQGGSDHPSYSIIRRIVFGDTRMQQIDWQNQYAYVIERVFERGKENEKKMTQQLMKRSEFVNLRLLNHLAISEESNFRLWMKDCLKYWAIKSWRC